MSNLWQPKFNATAIFQQVALPISFQAIAIATLLLLAHSEGRLYIVFALILSIIWLQLNENKSVQDYAWMRANRKLFVTVGRWLGQSDAEEVYDNALSEQLLRGESIEHGNLAQVATAMGLANLARSVIATLLKLYLLIQAALAFLDHLHAA